MEEQQYIVGVIGSWLSRQEEIAGHKLNAIDEDLDNK